MWAGGSFYDFERGGFRLAVYADEQHVVHVLDPTEEYAVVVQREHVQAGACRKATLRAAGSVHRHRERVGGQGRLRSVMGV